ncbi:transmembrane protein 53-like [Haliotis rufescens]|uniref:transmembrane protein 53-like n=1 Tax=Haliotis rufescens TaxID=6454 RepID=UPI001EB017DE|nr:transmembrane protein 53-like [Haliotis rufescens]
MSSIGLRRSFLSLRMSPFIQCVRLTSSAPVTDSVKFASNLELRSIRGNETLSRSRPLVVLVGWMNAKKRHLDKYGNLYISKGFDVLSVQVPPSKVIQPKKAQVVMQEVINILDDSSRRDKPLMIHGFSVGGYLYGEMLVTLRDQASRYTSIRDRLLGQIFDSPVDFAGVPRGFANVLGFNSFSRALIKSSIEGYLKLFKETSTKHYIKSSEAFHDNEMLLPSLLLYSRADPIGVAKDIEVVARKWASKGIPVHLKCWENSPHVSHFHRHPDEYVEAILAFLEEIGISAPESQEHVVQAKKERIP